MKYYSTNRKAPELTFQEAVVKGLASDNGLYYPERIDQLPASFFKNIGSMSFQEISFEVAKRFVDGEIPDADLKALVDDVLQFDTPIVEVEKDIYSLELFHGPTCAFKDVGGRFMARSLSYFIKNKGQDEVTILAATSGDTGSAVANGFLGVDGIKVVILYPKGKVSEIQEKQLTTLGRNIIALEVEGTFDDCQAMVKAAFLDEELNKKMKLTSANSINVARFLPQSFYLFWAYAQLKDRSKPFYVSIPSGNYGNICAGMFAKRMGLPVYRFITANNANNVVPRYLASGKYEPKPSVETIANAMDVGAPSNFVRIEELYGHDFKALKADLVGYSYTDKEIKQIMKDCYKNTGYVLDPHGAIGYQALKEELAGKNAQGVFYETAHPAKFIDIVEDVLGIEVEIPEQLQECLRKEKKSIITPPTLDGLKSYLINR